MPVELSGVVPYLMAMDRVGSIGVSLFFCLSSYLITKLLYLEQQRFGKVSLKFFYFRRILRIWPLYFLVLISLQYVSKLGSVLNTPFTQPFPIPCFVSYLSFVGNFYSMVDVRLYNCLGGLWSLCVEEQFYVFWPLLFVYVRSEKLTTWFYLLLGFSWFIRLLSGLSLVIWDASVLPAAVGPGFGYASWTHLDNFALGALFAVKEKEWLPHLRNPACLLVPLAFFPIFLNFFCGGPTQPWTFAGYGIVSAGCLVCLANCFDRPALSQSWLVYLGRISYGLYIFHLIVLRACEYVLFGGRFPSPTFVPSVGESLVATLLGLLLTVLIAQLSYRYFEGPILTLKTRYTRVVSRS